ncbi:MAG: TolC family protein [Gammaproteobacteria bacterium]|nr:TolC family protein [Gammaproteobacteria bacterium]
MFKHPTTLLASIRPYKVGGFTCALLINAIALGPAQANQSKPTQQESEYHQPLRLNHAIHISIQNDPWLAGNAFQQKALLAKSAMASQLPAPQFKVGIANLASDSFDSNQEAMTQLKAGVRQTFPRGQTQHLKRKKFSQLSEAMPHQRQNHRAQLRLNVSHAWLDTYSTQETLALIIKNRPLFEQLIDIAQSKYASALGMTHQQDVVRAQLELTRLDSRAVHLQQQRDEGLIKLSSWINDKHAFRFQPGKRSANNAPIYYLSRTMPIIEATMDAQTQSNLKASGKLTLHPSVLALDEHIHASQTAIRLAEQSHRPQFGLGLSYGFRDDAPSGLERADLLSLEVDFDLPVLRHTRSANEVRAAANHAESLKMQKVLKLRHLYTQLEVTQVQLGHLNERQGIYQTRLLPQMQEQSEASINAYTNDVGDFSEVMRSRIAELNAQIDYLSIQTEKQKTIAQLNYFFTGQGRSAKEKRYE